MEGVEGGWREMERDGRDEGGWWGVGGGLVGGGGGWISISLLQESHHT